MRCGRQHSQHTIWPSAPDLLFITKLDRNSAAIRVLRHMHAEGLDFTNILLPKFPLQFKNLQGGTLHVTCVNDNRDINLSYN